MLLKDVVCLVTGGASGLGLATVSRLLKNGAKIVAVDIQEDKGNKMAEQFGKDCTFIRADVSSEEDINKAISKGIELYGSINAVVNCAAIFSITHVISDDGELCHSLELFEKIFKVNATGTFNVARLAAKAMTTNVPNDKGERGVIINVSSGAAYGGRGDRVAYSASKGAVNSMILPLARDLAKFGIRVMGIAPGIFETPMTDDLTSNPPLLAQRLKTDVLFPSRLGKPDEFAELVQAIIENPMLNAEIIRIDAGAHS